MAIAPMQTVKEAVTKAFTKPLSLALPVFSFTPAEALEGSLQVQKLSDNPADGQAQHQKHTAAAGNRPLFHSEHFLQRPGNADHQGADPAALAQGVLDVFLQKSAEQNPGQTPGHNGSRIDDRSQAVHMRPSLFFDRKHLTPM